MNFQYLFFLFCFFIISCESNRRVAPPLPPGIERGMTWENASEYGHNDTVYTTPDYLPYPVRGSKFFTSALGDTYRKKQPCSDGPSTLTLQYVIGKEGKIIGLHPRSKLSSFCEQLILQTFERVEFVPGEHNGSPVNVLMAITIVKR